METSTQQQYWLFQYKADDAKAREDEIGAPGSTIPWRVTSYGERMKPNDLVFFWRAGSGSGLKAWGTIVDKPYLAADGKGNEVLVRVAADFGQPIPRDEVRAVPEILHLEVVMRGQQGTNFPVSSQQAAALARLIANKGLLAPDIGPAEVPASTKTRTERTADEPAPTSDNLDAGQNNRRAWLFHMPDNPAAFGERIESKTVPTDALRDGDIIFLWQSGNDGPSLGGWGVVADRRTALQSTNKEPYHPAILPRLQLRSPIEQDVILRSVVLSPNNRLRLERTLDFRLSPAEANGLAALLDSAYIREVRADPATRTDFVNRFQQHFSTHVTRLGPIVPEHPFKFEQDEHYDESMLLAFYIGLANAVIGTLELPSIRIGPRDLEELAAIVYREKKIYEDGKPIDPTRLFGEFSSTIAMFANRYDEYLPIFAKDRPNPSATVAYVNHLFGKYSDYFYALIEAVLRTLGDLTIGQGPSLEEFKDSTFATIDVANLGNDDPWRAALQDRLGVAHEARAFARISASRDFEPPLAFGIFGNWGSGKTFFLRLMYEHVKQLAARDAPESTRERFHDGIVQIRFNAWHYVETNLWASLVDHIFAELHNWITERAKGPEKANSLFERLATARELMLDATAKLVRHRREHNLAAERLASAERELAAVGALPRAFWQAVKDTLFEQARSKEELSKAAKILGLDHLAADTQALKAAIDGLTNAGKRADVVVNGLLRQVHSWPFMMAILAALFVVPFALVEAREWLLNSIRNPAWAEFLKSVQTTVLGISGALASLIGVVAVTTAHVRRAISKLEGFRERLDKAIEKQGKDPTETVKQAEAEFTKLSANVEEARALLTLSNDRLAEAAREYIGDSGRARLLRFIREKAVGGQYSKHLGLIATIRKDFEQLTSAMLSARTVNGAESREQLKMYRQRVDFLVESANDVLTTEEIAKLKESTKAIEVDGNAAFQRIILYVDDLDRCPPSKVVDVLQAVHLLLSFPLFVVVVAVDARWLGRAIEAHYPQLLSPMGSDRTKHDAATAFDYLEKIFQIPYWVRPMDAQASRDFLSDRAGPASIPAAQPTGDAARPVPEVGGHSAANTLRRVPAQLVEEPPNASPASRSPTSNVVRPSKAPTIQPVLTKSLEMTNAELRFMAALAPFVGSTPRQALRFLNLYRVVKASFEADGLERLTERGGYRPLMAQLAIATGAPTLLKSWLAQLEASDLDIDTVLTKLKPTSESDRREHLNLAGALTAFRGAADEGESREVVAHVVREHVSAFRHYAPLARRYSFMG